MTDIAHLDSLNLHGIYDVDVGGSIVSINSGLRSNDVKPPECWCGVPLKDIRRYQIHRKLADLKHNFDLLLAKMGRRIASFAAAVDMQRKQLDQTLEMCIKEIRPNPLAAKANAGLVLRRNQEILDLQKNIISFRSNVVDRFQSSMMTLHGSFPYVIPSYNLGFHLHLDVLEFRAVVVRLSDALRLSNQLLSLPDPSFGVQRLGLKNLQFVYKESISCVRYCQGALDNASTDTYPSLKAEIKLQQLQFMLFVKSTRAQLSELGHPIDDDCTDVNDETVRAGLDAVIAICRRSPGTCALLMVTAQDMIMAFERFDGSKPPSIPEIKNDYTRKIENLWRRHQLGSLTMCRQSHPYSATTFSDGCPNCGKQAQLSGDEIFRESGKHLFENQFLQFMHSKSGKSQKLDHLDLESPKPTMQSAEEPDSEEIAANPGGTESTDEERFLGAMRRALPQIDGGVPSNAVTLPSEAAVCQKAATKEDVGAGMKTKLEGWIGSQQPIPAEPQNELAMEEKSLVAVRKDG
ncbi:hypothetical protein Z517_02926 [Fonsecaea pedrosoi CBS 271.37]|uniref:Uncharacterized protein n=1 Tax=Fonsecaea pedrosoi CBS 271.37 TaxID=1442368 RepID=A0A0D2GYH5_9EURO|nr:uncharacterized protein Z517_02926 [Fonsecaea pedrosoi CBS 271.37]KIW83680.1 hypothetical protein Z517_02926 [Fonsecaea pedrosoi CBS 271.37]